MYDFCREKYVSSALKFAHPIDVVNTAHKLYLGSLYAHDILLKSIKRPSHSAKKYTIIIDPLNLFKTPLFVHPIFALHETFTGSFLFAVYIN